MPPKPQTKQALILERETRSSIELKRNAKGSYEWTVKVYYENHHDALADLEYIDKELRERYLPQTEDGQSDDA